MTRLSLPPASWPREARLTYLLGSHVLAEAHGGTASWATCECSCGHVASIPGGTRDMAHAAARAHVAAEIEKHIIKPAITTAVRKQRKAANE